MDAAELKSGPVPMKVLLIEDDPGDAFLIREMLREAAPEMALEQVARLAAAHERLAGGGLDIALLDLGLPDSQGVRTVRSLCETFRDLPVVVLTGLSDEDIGMQALQEGAQDYLVKGQIDSRLLAKSVRFAVERKRIQNEKEGLIQELQKALSEVKTLQGMLPICSSCKNIRDDSGYWNQIEVYISNHSDAEFSHGLCPSCATKLYPGLYRHRE